MKTHLQPRIIGLYFLIYCFFLPATSKSQFRFQLEKMSPTIYRVCAISENEYSPPLSTIVSAQVTLKIRYETDFNIEKIEPRFFSDKWKISSETFDLEKSPNARYLTINVSNNGEAPSKIIAHECLELFRFNTEKYFGNKIDFLLLEDADPMVLNKLKTRKNIANQVNILGFKEGIENAYKGNLPLKETSNSIFEITNIYPNPASTKLNLEWYCGEEEPIANSINIVIIDSSTGQVKKMQPIQSFVRGKNIVDVLLEDMAQGNYLIHLKNSNVSSNVLHFSKLN